MPTKQKSGLYRSKVKIGVDHKGRDVVKWISGKTKRELAQQREHIIAKYIDCTALEEDRLFGEYVMEWFTIRKAPSLSDSSRQSYRTALNKEILPVFGERNLRSIRPIELQEFLSTFAGASQTRITYIAASLRGVFDAACVDRILNRNPMERIAMPEATPAAEKRALTRAERERVTEVCRTHPEGAYLAAMYYLGVRPGECRGLQWRDFDWEAGLVHIQRDIDYKNHGRVGKLKTKQSNRLVPIPDALREILYPLRAAGEQFVFQERNGNPLSKNPAATKWMRLMVACGMTVARDAEDTAYPQSDIRAHLRPIITPHTLRHNYVTMCWEAGVDVYTAMRYVGHSSIATLTQIYTHLSERMMENGQARINAVFSSQESGGVVVPFTLKVASEK